MTRHEFYTIAMNMRMKRRFTETFREFERRVMTEYKRRLAAG
jgi:hypothetical protein